MPKTPRTLVALVVALTAVVAPLALAPASAAPPGHTPRFVRTIAGPGEAGVYAWGMEYNPVSDEILVGDYWNYQIRRYDPDNGHEIGAFYRPPSQYKGQPYTIE